MLRFVLRPNVPTAPAERAERRDSSDPRFPLAPVQTQNVFHVWAGVAAGGETSARQHRERRATEHTQRESDFVRNPAPFISISDAADQILIVIAVSLWPIWRKEIVDI